MRFKYGIGLLLVIFLTTHFAIAQQNTAPPDSTRLYRNIESYSKRSKFSKFIYRLVFKPVTAETRKKAAERKSYKKLMQKPYSDFNGKTIRHINIETLDPFGYSIADTVEVVRNFLARTGNSLHVKTRPVTIRNLLLIRQNQLFDPLLVKESERLVRSRNFVNDVAFIVKPVSKNSDSVDIYIRELDKWSIIPKVISSTAKVSLSLKDNNFLGLGHEFQDGFAWNNTNGDIDYNTRYFIPNIRNTFVNATMLYGVDELRNSIWSVGIDRPFFSPFAKWAAGTVFSQQFHKDYIRNADSVLILQDSRYNTQDYWVGSAVQIYKGNTETDRTTNFISTARYLRIHYLERPVEMIPERSLYADENFYLAGLGISTRKYVQDKYIFNFGLKEDVPIGKVYSITGGYQTKNNTGRLYLGARVSFGYYYTWGYLSTNFEYGSFFRASHAEQGAVSAAVNYFTGLIEMGKWKFRQFVKPQLTIGINRFYNDSLTLKDGYGLDGFNSNALTGTSRILLTFQTQSYAPWNLIGFRFGPYFICSLGMLGDATTGLKYSKVYSQIGFGILIKNDYLVINTFQLSFAFYPSIPGIGQNVIKTNSFKTTDFGFRDFEIGKPAPVLFQ